MIGVGLVLCGCSDATGGVDELGHNGYDVMACQEAKALALDALYSAVPAASVPARTASLVDDVSRSADPSVRAATESLIAGVRREDLRAVRASSASLVTACRLDRPVR